MILEGKNITYRYPGADSDILNGLNFKIKKGSINALMGFNGAGKSTLMNILSGLEEPSSGEILIHGKSIGKRREYIGYMLQEADLMLLNDSVREELLWNNKTMTEKNWIFYCTSFTYIIIGMISRLPYQRGSAFASFWEHYFHEKTMSFFY